MNSTSRYPAPFKRLWCYVTLLLIAGAGVLLPELALAGAWETTLQTVVDFLTDTTGRLLAVIAVAALGLMALAGRLDMRWALSVVVGIALIWGAAEVVDSFWG